MTALVDSHCHLDFPDLRDTLPDALALMKANDVRHALCVSVTLEDFPNVLALAYGGGAPLRATEPPVENYWALRRQVLRHFADPRLDALSAAESGVDAGVPLVLEWLQKWTYDLALHRLTGEVRYNVDQRAALDRLAPATDPVRILRLHREVTGMQRHAHHPLNARLFLEQLMMTYADALAPARSSR